MLKIEDLKVGDILIGNYTGQQYKIVHIPENNYIFVEYNVYNKIISYVIYKKKLDNYTLKPRQTKVYVVIWKEGNIIKTSKIYNKNFLDEIKNNCSVVDILTYYEDI